MPLVPAKCTQCGATLTIDPSQDAAVCPFCNTPFVVEKAINNYSVTNQTTIGTVEHVEHLHVDDARSVESRLKSAEAQLGALDLKEEAYRSFKALAQDRADEWRAWWGMARAKSNEFRNTANLHQPDLGEVEECAEHAIQLAPADERPRLRETFDAFKKEIAKTRYAELHEEVGDDWQRIGKLSAKELIVRYEETKKEQKDLKLQESTAVRIERSQSIFLIVVAGVLFVFSIVFSIVNGAAPGILTLITGVALALCVLKLQVNHAKIGKIRAKLSTIEDELAAVERDLIAKRRWAEQEKKWQDERTMSYEQHSDLSSILFYENMPLFWWKAKN